MEISMSSLVLLTAPVSEPVSVSDAKAHMRVETSDDDALIQGLIIAARQSAESFTGRSLITQTWQLWLDNFYESGLSPDYWWDGMREGPITGLAHRSILIPRPPLLSVQSVTVYDDADVGTVWGSANYFVDTARAPGRLAVRNGSAWPMATRAINGVCITFQAGYGASGGSVPAAIRQGILAHATWLYENRGDRVDAESMAMGHDPTALPVISEALYRPYKIMRL
jgi:uncharacterized phiE125 gp8 family phage protein